jgi:hypothetical protein
MSKTSSKKVVPAKAAAAKLSGKPSVAPSTALALPEGVKLVRNVSLPSLVMKTEGESRTLVICEAMHESRVPGKKDANGVQEKPATVCTVGDTETGEQFMYLVPAVVRDNLVQSYPDDDYVGRCFHITHMGKAEGKRYSNFRILEVEVAPQS